MTVSLASVIRLPMIESGSIVGSRSLDQLIRDRRSEGRKHGGGPDIPGETADYSEERLAGYRFGDEYFKDRSDESERPSEHAQISGNEATGDRADGCERVVKDSMICMLCENPKTHSKYEQCSYVARPHENIQSYASSKSYSGRPATSQQNNQRAEQEESSGEQGRNKDEASGEKTSNQEESSDERPSRYYSSDDDDDDDDEAKSDDYYGDASKYGGNEKQQPNEYEDRLGESSYKSPARRAHRPSKKGGESNCHEVRKDSMTCTVCKDPENGGNFEKCSYNHQPNDKLYKYSKSKSFGYPAESDARETKRVDKIADPPASNNNRRQCQRFRKNSSTTCNICRDALTGEKFEECEYNLKPEHAERQISRTAR